MKSIFMIMLFVVGCADNYKEQETQVVNQNNTNSYPNMINDQFIQNMLSELSNSTFTMFDKLFDTSQLAPYRYIGDFECISNNITNYSSPTHKGKVIAYTNQYGILFFNDEEILFTPDDLQIAPYGLTEASVLSETTNLYQQVIEQILPLTNLDTIINIYSNVSVLKDEHVTEVPNLGWLLYYMGIEYDWVTIYFYDAPTYYNDQILWYTDEFNSVLDNKVKTRMLYNILKSSKNPSMAFINGWLYSILTSGTYYKDNTETKLLMLDEAPLE